MRLKIKSAATEVTAPKNANSDCRQTNRSIWVFAYSTPWNLHFYQIRNNVKYAEKRYNYPIKEKIPLMQNIRFVWLFNSSILLQKYQVFGRKNKKGTTMCNLQLDFDAEHQYASPCRLQASLTRSAVGMRTRFAPVLCANKVRLRCLVQI